MSLNVLFHAGDENWQTYKAPLIEALNQAGVSANLACNIPAQDVDYIVYAPNSALQDFTPYIRAKAVLSLWAGVESIATNQTLKMPLARMVDHGMTQGMVEYVCGHVLRHHLSIDRYIARNDTNWLPHVPPLASDRQVCVLGLGALGQACANTLANLGFNVSGWSRREKTIEGIQCYHGDHGLKTALQNADTLVLLLPLTSATENLLNDERLSWLPKGAVVINPGRGPLIDDTALINALDSGQLSHATLDVFRIEPLPREHPFWAHPKVTITPHIASETRVETASQAIAENIRRGEAGEPLLNLVDRKTGY